MGFDTPEKASAVGRLGGRALVDKHGVEHMSRIALRGGEKTKMRGKEFYASLGRMNLGKRFFQMSQLVADYNGGMHAEKLTKKYQRSMNQLYLYLHQADQKEPGSVQWRTKRREAIK